MGLGTAGKRVYIGKFAGIGIFDPVGDQVGRIRGVVATFQVGGTGNVIGFVVEARPRKRVFLPLTRVTSIEAGLVTTTGLLNMRSFAQHPVEALVFAELLGRVVTLDDGSGEARILDIAMERRRPKDWVISKLHVQRQRITALGFTRSGETLNVRVSEVSGLLKVDTNQVATSLIAQTEGMHPADLVSYLYDLPIERQMAIAQRLPDARLADILEELGDGDRVAIMSGLEANRAADVLDVVQPDNAADLVSELSKAQAQALLSLMGPKEAKDVCRLLSCVESIAGSLMTADSVIFDLDVAVTQVFASARREDLPASLVAVAFIARPPGETPTGPCPGMVHIQHALRGPPQTPLGTILDSDIETVPPRVHITTVTRLLVTHNLTVLPVVDKDSHLLDAASVDDLLDEFLPEDWRGYDDGVADRIMAGSING